MLNARLASDLGNSCSPGDVLDGVFLCCPFSHEMSRMRYGT